MVGCDPCELAQLRCPTTAGTSELPIKVPQLPPSRLLGLSDFVNASPSEAIPCPQHIPSAVFLHIHLLILLDEFMDHAFGKIPRLTLTAWR